MAQNFLTAILPALRTPLDPLFESAHGYANGAALTECSNSPEAIMRYTVARPKERRRATPSAVKSSFSGWSIMVPVVLPTSPC